MTSSTIRTLAAAAALAAASLAPGAAWATSVTIDFSDFTIGQDTLNNWRPTSNIGHVSVVGDTASVSGDSAFARDGNFVLVNPASQNGFSFILDDAQQFDSVNFWFRTTNVGLTATIWSSGSAFSVEIQDGTAIWESASRSLGAGQGDGFIDRIDFSFTDNDFGIDDIRFSNSSSGGGTIPEPSSYGLVALALLGAGLASRRRKA